jgi:hypothetical protein
MNGLADFVALFLIIVVLVASCVNEKTSEFYERCRLAGGTPSWGLFERQCFAPGILLNIGKPAEKK